MACNCGGKSPGTDTSLWNVMDASGRVIQLNVQGEFNAKVKAKRIGGKYVKAS